MAYVITDKARHFARSAVRRAVLERMEQVGKPPAPKRELTKESVRDAAPPVYAMLQQLHATVTKREQRNAEIRARYRADILTAHEKYERAREQLPSYLRED